MWVVCVSESVNTVLNYAFMDFFSPWLGSTCHICVCAYLKVVSILQWEALSFQPDSFALFSSDAVDALVVVIVVGGEVRREQNAFWSKWGGSTLRYSKTAQGAGTAQIKITAFLPNYIWAGRISRLVYCGKKDRRGEDSTWKREIIAKCRSGITTDLIQLSRNDNDNDDNNPTV